MNHTTAIERFRAKFEWIENPSFPTGITAKLEKFLQEELEGAVRAERELLIGEIEELQKTYGTSNNGRAPYDTHGYSHALIDVLQILDETT